MSLQNYIPQIDDRRYEDILAEVRTRIARYTPEWTPVWTDVNDSDPGVTLVQLFAWLTEMLIYRLGKVPELNYLKFLQLLGIELQPAEPATAEITFPVLETFADPYVIVPLRTQVSAEATDGGRPVTFAPMDELEIQDSFTTDRIRQQDLPYGEESRKKAGFDVAVSVTV